MVKDLVVVLFAATTGFTASGITANLYRLLVRKADNSSIKLTYLAVMVLAGPSVLFENAASSRRTKACSNLAFWMAAAISTYWSLMIGFLLLDVVLALR